MLILVLLPLAPPTEEKKTHEDPQASLPTKSSIRLAKSPASAAVVFLGNGKNVLFAQNVRFILLSLSK